MNAIPRSTLISVCRRAAAYTAALSIVTAVALFAIAAVVNSDYITGGMIVSSVLAVAAILAYFLLKRQTSPAPTP